MVCLCSPHLRLWPIDYCDCYLGRLVHHLSVNAMLVPWLLMLRRWQVLKRNWSLLCCSLNVLCVSILHGSAPLASTRSGLALSFAANLRWWFSALPSWACTHLMVFISDQHGVWTWSAPYRSWSQKASASSVCKPIFRLGRVARFLSLLFD